MCSLNGRFDWRVAGSIPAVSINGDLTGSRVYMEGGFDSRTVHQFRFFENLAMVVGSEVASLNE